MKKKAIISRKEKAAETKIKIYKSAEQLFDKYGFDNVNINDIVENAGVAKGSFYVHFESKNTLIAALINDYVNKVDMDYRTYLESFSSDTPAPDILISLVGKIADVITSIIGYENMKNLYKVQITKDINTQAVMDYNRDIYKMFQVVISKGVQQGVFRSDLSVDDITKHFMLAYRGLTYEWCIRYPDFDLKEQVLKHFKILLTGINSKL